MPERDVQIVPVSIYVGRAPSRDSGWFRVLFSENWVVVGRFRRLLALLLNGRDTVVQFSAPVSLRAALDESGEIQPERFARKIARVLRTHFRRIRAAVIGPDLSHRRTVVDAVLNAEPVRAAIAASASQGKDQPRQGLAQGAEADAGNRRRLLAPGGALGLVPAVATSGTSCTTASPCTTSTRRAPPRPATKWSTCPATAATPTTC